MASGAAASDGPPGAEIGSAADAERQQPARGDVQEIPSPRHSVKSSNSYVYSQTGTKVKVWNSQANEWRYAFAQDLEHQAKKGAPGKKDARGWTSHKKIGWLIYPSDPTMLECEPPGPDDDAESKEASFWRSTAAGQCEPPGLAR